MKVGVLNRSLHQAKVLVCSTAGRVNAKFTKFTLQPISRAHLIPANSLCDLKEEPEVEGGFKSRYWEMISTVTLPLPQLWRVQVT